MCFIKRREESEKMKIIKNRRRESVLFLSLITVLLSVMTIPVTAYDIDGNLKLDWGVDPEHGDWVPDTGAITSYILEDYPGPGQTYPRDEVCDIEALYIDNDANNIYVAIITSMPPGGFAYPAYPLGWHTTELIIPGDLAIDVCDPAGSPFNAAGYEYGIKLTSVIAPVSAGGDNPVNAVQGAVFHYPNWGGAINQQSVRHNTPAAWFSSILEGSGSPIYTLGTDEFKYSIISGYTDQETFPEWPVSPSPQQRYNYAIEMKIPKSVFELDGGSGICDNNINVMTAVSCLNDEIHKDRNIPPTEIPEFSTIALPACTIIALFYFYRRKRQNKNNND